MRTLSHAAARSTYDRIGAFQDSQGFYEDIAVAELIAHADFARAHSVVELGHGTGRHAARLLEHHLPRDARYLGIDVSETMNALARERLAPFGDRVELVRSDGPPTLDAPAGSFDRFISTYVFDLLSEADIELAVAEAHRVLVEDGRLCVVSLTHGRTLSERVMIGAFERLGRVKPEWVGGCRPIDLLGHLSPSRWRLLYRSVVSPFGVATEVVVATPIRR